MQGIPKRELDRARLKLGDITKLRRRKNERKGRSILGSILASTGSAGTLLVQVGYLIASPSIALAIPDITAALLSMTSVGLAIYTMILEQATENLSNRSERLYKAMHGDNIDNLLEAIADADSALRTYSEKSGDVRRTKAGYSPRMARFRSQPVSNRPIPHGTPKVSLRDLIKIGYKKQTHDAIELVNDEIVSMQPTRKLSRWTFSDGSVVLLEINKITESGQEVYNYLWTVDVQGQLLLAPPDTQERVKQNIP